MTPSQTPPEQKEQRIAEIEARLKVATPGAAEVHNADMATSMFFSSVAEDVAWLLAELRRLEEDAKRLDWLEVETAEKGVDLDWFDPGFAAPIVMLTLRERVRNREFSAASLREAIDAARNANSRKALEPSPVERAGQ